MKPYFLAWHVFRRELLDQWRDRRTLLSVIFLPLLLYPIMGLAMLQVMQFVGEKPTRVLVIGQQHLQPAAVAGPGPLFVDDDWNPQWLNGQAESLAKLDFLGEVDATFEAAIHSVVQEPEPISAAAIAAREKIQTLLRERQADVLLWIAPTAARTPHDGSLEVDPEQSQASRPSLHLLQNTVSDQSRIATGRVEQILQAWYIAGRSAAAEAHPEVANEPFEYAASDLAPPAQLNSQVWSKILPFILFLWTLTGAFYCAVDCCAGEKERGTLEALLVTPATRTQIVLGKLWTTMAFSLTSGMVNLLGTVVTGWFVSRQLGALAAEQGLANFGPPPLYALAWLVVGAVPISALFSAISLAVAAFARSTKEGQHYLMPILMVSLPLLTLPMLPGMQLDLGISLIPVTGMLFWLRSLLEGEYWMAARFTLPVLLVNGWCVYLALGWAVYQFQQESVLFRPVERFSLLPWLATLLRPAGPVPAVAQVVMLLGVVMSLKVILTAAAPVPSAWDSFVWHTLIVLVGAVALPPIVLAIASTGSWVETLRLRPVPWTTWVASLGLAVCFHPLILWFQQFVMHLYPMSMDTSQIQQTLQHIVGGAPGMWAIVLVMAIAPAICEELTFRGFVFSGLLKALKPFNAILISAILFGAMHGLLQQSIVATATGVLIGFLAWRTASLWPCIAYHAAHNALTLQFAFLNPAELAESKWLRFVLEFEANEQGQLIGLSYTPWAATFLIVCGLWLCLYLKPSADSKSPPSDSGVRFRRTVATRSASEGIA
jgi:sodium transport system permease protein